MAQAAGGLLSGDRLGRSGAWHCLENPIDNERIKLAGAWNERIGDGGSDPQAGRVDDVVLPPDPDGHAAEEGVAAPDRIGATNLRRLQSGRAERGDDDGSLRAERDDDGAGATLQKDGGS